MLSGDYGVSHVFSLDAEHLYAVIDCAVDSEEGRGTRFAVTLPIS